MAAQYNQLTLEERERIYTLKEQGLSFRSIGQILDRSHRTIAREYARNRNVGQEYIPCRAQEISIKRGEKQRTKAPLKNPQVFLYVREHLRLGWSPEMIAGRLSIDMPGQTIVAETIYQYIYGKGKKYRLQEYLTRSHKKRRIKTGRSVHKSKSRIPHTIMIEKRPTRANNRSQSGHFETDLMEGPRGTSAVLSVSVERKSRYTLIAKAENKKSKTVQKVLQNYLKPLQSLSKSMKPIVRSVTSDNGLENTRHKETSGYLKINWYFCNPYHSWEKGSVENRIGVIRRFIPKGIPLHTYTDEEIRNLENMINSRPMKCLGFRTPEEVFMIEVNRYKFKNYQISKWGTSK